MAYPVVRNPSDLLPPISSRSIAPEFEDRFARYVQHVERIEEILHRAEGIVRGAARDPDIAALGRLRWELSRTVREYQLFKHMMIFDPLIAAGGWQASMARELKDDCLRAGADYRDYLARWSVVSTLDHWSEYKPAALAAAARMRRHMTRERTRMEQLLSD
jgi:hypothetical protein